MTVAIKRATFKHIEAELYAYPDTKREIARLREEIMYGSVSDDENTGGGSNSCRTPGRPTERIATRLMSDKRLRNHEELVYAIETVYNSLDDTQKQLIKLRYWNGRNKASWERIAIDCNIGERTVYRYRDMVVEAIAEKVGWR